MRSLATSLMFCLILPGACPSAGGSQPPEKQDPAEEPKKLNEAIEKSIDWYDMIPEEGAAALKPVPVLRWRNVVRGQEGEAMMVVWPHGGRPIAMASIYPWEGKMLHEFDSLSRGGKLMARERDRVIWSPQAAGVEFKELPKSPGPARTAAERLRQMKTMAEGFKATMTGWAADSSDREQLRLLPRPLHRYDLNVKNPDPKLLDGALFAYVLGTDPEVVLILEAVGTSEKAEWQFAFARATSGGLEVKRDGEIVWTAKMHPAGRVATLPHFTMQRILEK
ncbi:MAG TPA: hypothetical protein VGL71_11435 [Urbifossiella sp.]